MIRDVHPRSRIPWSGPWFFTHPGSPSQKKAPDPGSPATLIRLLSSLITEQVRNRHVCWEKQELFCDAVIAEPAVMKQNNRLFIPITKRYPPRRIAVRPSSSSALSLSSTGSGMSSPFRRIHSLFPTSTYVRSVLKGLSGQLRSDH